MTKSPVKREVVLIVFFTVASICLYFLPTGFEELLPENTENCRGTVLAVDNTNLKQMGIVRVGSQTIDVKIETGKFKGRVVSSVNQLMGKMELDKVFDVGDSVLTVLTIEDGEIVIANAQDHYRLNTELLLLICFSLLLILFAGLTGAKALLSFLFAGLMIWKILVPMFLKNYDPVLVSFFVVTIMACAIILLVGGFSRKSFTAIGGTILGIITTSCFAVFFSQEFHLHGAVKPFSETLLYSGFPYLDLNRIFIAGIFMASSGAVMDLAMDVAASVKEVVNSKPDITFTETLKSGLRVGRVVLGTMTTTLLLAYSGGYITLLMVFMAQGVPLANLFNINYVAAEVLHTLIGSFGLITVAPFTALVGAYVYTSEPCRRTDVKINAAKALTEEKN